MSGRRLSDGASTQPGCCPEVQLALGGIPWQREKMVQAEACQSLPSCSMKLIVEYEAMEKTSGFFPRRIPWPEEPGMHSPWDGNSRT